MRLSVFLLCFSLLHLTHFSSGGLFLSFTTNQLQRKTKPSVGSSAAPSPSPAYQGPTTSPHHRPFHRRRGHHHRLRPHMPSPAPAATPGCGQTCLEPLAPAVINTPCGCVFPMKVRLLLSIAVYAVFHEVNELEIEIASGTYLKQDQVQIVGATADSENQERTLVDINLVPLAEKFDNTTALLTYERLRRKAVPLNTTLFGIYDVIYISYPGLPSQFPSGGDVGNGPAGSVVDGQYPVTANVMNKNKKISSGIVCVIVFSACVLLVACSAAIYIIVKWRMARNTSNASGPLFTPSTDKKNGIGSTLSSSIASSTFMSLFTSIPAYAFPVKTFTIAELVKATDKFSSCRILGEGGFGRVYHGVLEDGVEVAVKLLTKDDQNGDREFIAEVELLSRLHHRNLVKLIGICIEGHRRCLVYEVVHNGSVDSHLHGVDMEKGPLDWDARLKIALGAARGLAYLHEDSNPRVIHRDFKASNVLLEEDFTPKVSDFGLAREATQGSQHISTRVMGTFGYVAPEYAMTGHLLVKSDVYSYGVVLLELLTGRKPVDMSRPQGQENLVTWARPLLSSREGVEQLVDPTLDGKYNFDDLAKVAAIASMCVHPEVTHRPFMGEVVQALKLIYNDSDETCEDCGSLKDSSVLDMDNKSDIEQSETSWWNAGYGHGGSFITMDYSSGPLDATENRPFSSPGLAGERGTLPHANRSGPLRTVKNKPLFYRLKGSMSEHAGYLSGRARSDGFWG
ncbi:receptor-like serine/threonine-protein kinase ALE2 isoform X1 [Silene latifolia]|uniref:receptor-like serine/threonine-protein kinase ALE2 isoform X1 n=2 Tax=Silene latifolia TaxID=37657 RepID=UPI003D77B131